MQQKSDMKAYFIGLPLYHFAFLLILKFTRLIVNAQREGCQCSAPRDYHLLLKIAISFSIAFVPVS
jgi:hypothetical protein